MNDINKQKFLTELGRLLTFMYDEDRQTALSMFSDMFDDAQDEQALIRYLVSPTRQAVVLARLYDAKERKLKVHSQSMGEGDQSGVTPAFVEAVLKIREDAPLGNGEEIPSVRQEEKGQISLFMEESSDEIADAPGEAEAPADELPAETEEKGDVEQFSDQIDSFLADFRLPPMQSGDSVEEEEEKKESGEEENELTELPEAAPVQEAPDTQEAAPVKNTKRAARVGLLIPYIILAIPVTLGGIALLLIPTLVCLALAGMVLYLGVTALAASFGTFSVFADTLLMLGASIVVLSLGLLLGWLFIWFILGPMVGLVKGIIRLGGKWCYKEVEV